MIGFGSPLSSGDEDDTFDGYDEFVPETLPEPGSFLEDQAVLVGESHVAFHERTRELFDERGVYDMTFGYNLARLNLDRRHSDAGYRYAEERSTPRAVDRADGIDGTRADDRSVLRAEFTPTTPFCPQSETLTIGSFRAWNGLSERHDYDLVRVRLHASHHESEAINEELASMEATFAETGEVERPSAGGDGPEGSSGGPRSMGNTSGGPDAPF